MALKLHLELDVERVHNLTEETEIHLVNQVVEVVELGWFGGGGGCALGGQDSSGGGGSKHLSENVSEGKNGIWKFRKTKFYYKHQVIQTHKF